MTLFIAFVLGYVAGVVLTLAVLLGFQWLLKNYGF